MFLRITATLFAFALLAGTLPVVGADADPKPRRKIAVTAESARTDPDTARWRKIVTTLEAEQSAASLLTAALIHLSPLGDKPKALALIDSTATLVPADPSIAWLASNVCAQIEDCDVADRAGRLIDLDSGNAAAYYPALVQARRKKDVAAEDRALAAMAESGYFDVYWSKLMVRAVEALSAPRGRSKAPLRDIRWAVSDVINGLVVAVLPSFSSASDGCKDERLSRDDVRARCRRLVEVFENGDTYIAQAIGRSIGRRVYSSGDPQLAQIEQRQRQYRYESETVGPHSAAATGTNEGAIAWLDRFRVHRRESDVYRAWLIELGLPPDAPADYVVEQSR